ncbi:hypothetical protein P3G55_22280, partial [Leptospira sp. 96542]|nr:hypothetical protein [Leptospira sp. 96542]
EKQLIEGLGVELCGHGKEEGDEEKEVSILRRPSQDCQPRGFRGNSRVVILAMMANRADDDGVGIPDFKQRDIAGRAEGNQQFPHETVVPGRRFGATEKATREKIAAISDGFNGTLRDAQLGRGAAQLALQA